MWLQLVLIYIEDAFMHFYSYHYQAELLVVSVFCAILLKFPFALTKASRPLTIRREWIPNIR